MPPPVPRGTTCHGYWDTASPPNRDCPSRRVYWSRARRPVLIPSNRVSADCPICAPRSHVSHAPNPVQKEGSAHRKSHPASRDRVPNVHADLPTICDHVPGVCTRASVPPGHSRLSATTSWRQPRLRSYQAVARSEYPLATGGLLQGFRRAGVARNGRRQNVRKDRWQPAQHSAPPAGRRWRRRRERLTPI